MGKEYTHRHGRRKKRKKSKAKKKKTGRRKARSPHKAPRPGFRKRRRYAARPQRAPAQVLQERTTQAMMIELARQLLTGARSRSPTITGSATTYRQHADGNINETQTAVPEPRRPRRVPAQACAPAVHALFCSRRAGRPRAAADVPRVHCAIRTALSFLISCSTVARSRRPRAGDAGLSGDRTGDCTFFLIFLSSSFSSLSPLGCFSAREHYFYIFFGHSVGLLNFHQCVFRLFHYARVVCG